MNIKYLLVFTAMLGFQYSNAQVGMMTNGPDKSAILDLANPVNKGLLIPRIALTNTAVAVPVTNPATSLMVYNTATAGDVTPGYYYWDGVKWVKLVINTDLGAAGWLPGGNTNGALKTIGTKDTYDLPFITNGAEQMRLGTNGGLGLGTKGASATSIVDIINDNRGASYDDINVKTYNDGNQSGALFFGRSRGTLATPTNLIKDDILGSLSFQGRANGGIQQLSNISSSYKGDGINKLSDIEFRASGQERMRIDEDGNLGIGTTTPGSKLTVNGKTQIIDGTQADNYVFTSDANGVGSWKAPAAAAGGWLPDGNTNGALKTIGTNDNYALPFVTNGIERMRLATDGSLGIGTKGAATSGVFEVVNDNRGAAFDDLHVKTYNDLNQGGGFFFTRSRGTVAAPVDLAKDDQLGNLTFRGRSNGGINKNAEIVSYYKGDGTNNLGDLEFSTSGAERMRIAENGNVGIGTSNPGNKLTVNGGKVQIVDGTQGADYILTSDANGTGTWKRPIGQMLGNAVTLGGGVNISGGGSYKYTTTSITLPPGRWLVSVTMLMSKQALTGSNESWWVRSTFCNSSSTYATTPDIVGTGNLVSGLLPPGCTYALLTGSLVINNATAGNKTYYYWAGDTAGSANLSGSLINFGGTFWGENVITAQAL